MSVENVAVTEIFTIHVDRKKVNLKPQFRRISVEMKLLELIEKKLKFEG
jgi:hypothetical protein